ncbi:MAG: UDP-N-acetylglucosamine 1-carboxyvinyltransferase [Candidatus Omnitrophota bacterium]|nr:MAG: UDP-N-acetylglucosamine 1-carboxyvinyltransferase [Candidatus Omnitrophota bacterium]RKY43423.1 MAG: UDP-N-acetylglucosamine 1-carboxyvinyltransferase [Candidatus Omnitrophota bacterium]
MDKIEIFGGKRIKGRVKLSGSKNATLPIMAATLLTDEPCIIENVPHLSDVYTMAKLLIALGKEVKFEDHTLTIKTRSNKSFSAPYKLVRTMRASFCVLGPLLAKRKKAKVSLPGGCVIGVRPVDLHLKGLNCLGANIKISGGYCYANPKKLEGKEVFLGGPFGSSVLATANVMMASTLAKGETIIDFSACEPEVVDLARVLKKMGAEISGEGTPQIRIKGKKSLGGFKHRVISDRIEAGTFIVFSLATGGEIEIEEISPQFLGAVIDTLRKMNQKVLVKGFKLYVKRTPKILPANIVTLPFPGFPTDLQAQFMVLLSLAKGVSTVTEKVYPDRFMHIPELNRMGARISRFREVAIIEGIDKFSPAEVMASDLRASASLVAAGLSASGKTTIHRVYHLDRGYENFVEKLERLGAELRRTKE